MVRISNGRYWHKIQSEYRQRFGIRMPTVVRYSDAVFIAKTWSYFAPVIRWLDHFWWPSCFSHWKTGRFCQVTIFSSTVHFVLYSIGWLSHALLQGKMDHLNTGLFRYSNLHFSCHPNTYQTTWFGFQMVQSHLDGLIFVWHLNDGPFFKWSASPQATFVQNWTSLGMVGTQFRKVCLILKTWLEMPLDFQTCCRSSTYVSKIWPLKTNSNFSGILGPVKNSTWQRAVIKLVIKVWKSC
jgi:hypothetical protein